MMKINQRIRYYRMKTFELENHVAWLLNNELELKNELAVKNEAIRETKENYTSASLACEELRYRKSNIFDFNDCLKTLSTVLIIG